MDNKYTNFYGGILSKFNLVVFEINISMSSLIVAPTAGSANSGTIHFNGIAMWWQY